MDVFFFFNDTATTEIYTLSLHDALPICPQGFDDHDHEHDQVDRSHHREDDPEERLHLRRAVDRRRLPQGVVDALQACQRSEEHTSELQSRQYLVCRLLLEKKKTHTQKTN